MLVSVTGLRVDGLYFFNVERLHVWHAWPRCASKRSLSPVVLRRGWSSTVEETGGSGNGSDIPPDPVSARAEDRLGQWG